MSHMEEKSLSILGKSDHLVGGGNRTITGLEKTGEQQYPSWIRCSIHVIGYGRGQLFQKCHIRVETCIFISIYVAVLHFPFWLLYTSLISLGFLLSPSKLMMNGVWLRSTRLRIEGLNKRPPSKGARAQTKHTHTPSYDYRLRLGGGKEHCQIAVIFLLH